MTGNKKLHFQALIRTGYVTGYIQGMLEALTMLTTVEDGKRFKIKLEQFRQNLLLSGDYDATGNYKQAVKKTAV